MKKILVVEDEYYARKSIVKILQESDLDIQVCGEAANGMKAIELLEEYKDIALVITDIQMQKMGGLELASYLHKHIPEIDVLILTAFENFDYAREALRYNVKDYIVKPIYKENLLPPVKKVLEKQEEKSRNQEKIKNYYQWEAAKNYFPVKTIVAHEELYKEFFSYNAIHQEEKFCIVVMQEEELVTDVELVNRIIQEKYRGFIKDFFFSKINEEYVMLLSGIECMDNELIVQEKVESMLSYFCTCKHMNITMGVGLVYSSKEKIYQSYNEALYALNQRLIQGWNRAYFYKNMDGYKARIGKEAEIKLESIVRTRKEKEINQVIHSILEDIIIKEESAQKLYMAVVEILKILGNYYAELYQDEDIEELKDIKVMFSRRYDLYKFKHIEELENYLKEMVIVICSGKENTKKKSKIVEEIVHYVENNYYKNISLRELAENKYFVNYSYCSRLFSQETGMNFSKYLIQYRLKKAKTLLENKDMGLSFYTGFIGPYILEKGYTQSTIGVINSISALSEVPVLFYINRMLRKHGTIKILFLSCFLMGIRILLPIRSGIIGIVLAQLLQGVTYMTMYYSCAVYISTCVYEKYQTKGQSILNVVQLGLGAIVGNLVGGKLIRLLGYEKGYLLMAGITTLMTICALIVYFWKNREQRNGGDVCEI